MACSLTLNDINVFYREHKVENLNLFFYNTEFNQISNLQGGHKVTWESGLLGFHIDKEIKQKIFNLDPRKAFTPILKPKNLVAGQRPDIFRDIFPLLPKPDFILCHRIKGKEHLHGHYGHKNFHYGTIKTETAATIDSEYEAKIAEYKKKGPVFFVAHDAGNQAATFHSLLSFRHAAPFRHPRLLHLLLI